VLGIRIRRLRMFLGLPDPDPLVRGMDPDPDPDPFSHRCVERTACKIKFKTQNFSKKIKYFRLKMMCRFQVIRKKFVFCIFQINEERSRRWSWIRIRIHLSEGRIRIRTKMSRIPITDRSQADLINMYLHSSW
jgi:hypothetical protein